MDNCRLQALLLGHVDDLIRTCDYWFKKRAEKTKEVFKVSDEKYPLSNSTGFNLSRFEIGVFHQDQIKYLMK